MNQNGDAMEMYFRETLTIAIECLGVRMAVECGPTEAGVVSAHVPFGSTPASQADASHKFIFEADGQANELFRVRRCSPARALPWQPLSTALRTLQKELHICVAEYATTRVFIHAGVITWQNRTLVLPGFSHAGKSTLVWSLVQAGAVYYSDEYAVFDEHGDVHPFTLPISLRVIGGETRFVDPDRCGSGPVPPSVIAFAKFKPGAVWMPRSLSPAESMLQLVRHSIAIRRHPTIVFPILKTISLQTQAFIGRRGEAAQILEWLFELEQERAEQSLRCRSASDGKLFNNLSNYD